MGEDVRNRELLLQALRRLALIRGEGGDVDQPGDAVVGARGRDDGPAVRVAHENGRAADAPQRTGYRGDVAFERVEAVLGGHHLVPVRLKRRDHLAETRAVGPEPVREDDACFGWHGCSFDETHALTAFTLGRPAGPGIARTCHSLAPRQMLAGQLVTCSCRHCPGERPWCLVNARLKAASDL